MALEQYCTDGDVINYVPEFDDSAELMGIDPGRLTSFIEDATMEAKSKMTGRYDLTQFVNPPAGLPLQVRKFTAVIAAIRLLESFQLGEDAPMRLKRFRMRQLLFERIIAGGSLLNDDGTPVEFTRNGPSTETAPLPKGLEGAYDQSARFGVRDMPKRETVTTDVN